MSNNITVEFKMIENMSFKDKAESFSKLFNYKSFFYKYLRAIGFNTETSEDILEIIQNNLKFNYDNSNVICKLSIDGIKDKRFFNKNQYVYLSINFILNGFKEFLNKVIPNVDMDYIRQKTTVNLSDLFMNPILYNKYSELEFTSFYQYLPLKTSSQELLNLKKEVEFKVETYINEISKSNSNAEETLKFSCFFINVHEKEQKILEIEFYDLKPSE